MISRSHGDYFVGAACPFLTNRQPTAADLECGTNNDSIWLCVEPKMHSVQNHGK